MTNWWLLKHHWLHLSGCTHIWLITVQLLLLCHPAVTKSLPDIYWNVTNPIFHLDNTLHVMQVNIMDTVTIKCPFVPPGRLYNDTQVQHSQIYSVSKWSYDRCMLTADSTLVGTCDDPYRQSQITTVFRQFTPLPGGLEFTPGQSYYFISTSTGTKTGLANRHGGLCLHHNMRLTFEVLDGKDRRNNRVDQSSSRHQQYENGRLPSDSSQRQHLSTTTPLMYVVGTLPPNDPYYRSYQPAGTYDGPNSAYGANTVRDRDMSDEDDDGAACGLRLGTYTIMIGLVLSMLIGWIR